jgi:cytochrome c-type biogenesis protein CcmH
MTGLRTLLLSALIFLAAPALALIETYDFTSPELEARYQYLSDELRCPKCQNQNIADSNAPIAQDLRRLLHQQLESGASDDEILDHMVDRYGDFVRYRPAFEGTAILLWLAPVLLFIGAVGVLVVALRSRAAEGDEGTVLTAEDKARLEKLLHKTERDS